MKYLAILMMIVLAACDSVTTTELPRTSGSGTVITESRDVTGFNHVQLSGQGDVDVTAGEAFSITVRSDDNIVPLLTTTLNRDTLVLGVVDWQTLRPSDGILFTITLPDLKGLMLGGNGDMSAVGVNTGSFFVEIKGAGDVTVSGQTERLRVSVTGVGDVNAYDLSSQDVTAEITGVGDLFLDASSTLSVTLAGVGDVHYQGSPRLRQTITGVGSVSAG